jgi:hypothetical protein
MADYPQAPSRGPTRLTTLVDYRSPCGATLLPNGEDWRRRKTASQVLAVREARFFSARPANAGVVSASQTVGKHLIHSARILRSVTPAGGG